MVFPKKWAPSQPRWKKIKQRLVPSSFNISFVCEPIQLSGKESDVAKVRDKIEEISKM